MHGQSVVGFVTNLKEVDGASEIDGLVMVPLYLPSVILLTFGWLCQLFIAFEAISLVFHLGEQKSYFNEN